MSWAIWVTGRPGSGKSAVARAAAAELRSEGLDVVHLELDELRRTWTPTPTYSDAEREMVYAGLAQVAASLVAAGAPVLIDATAHRRAWRDRARAIVPRFAEVQLECSLEVSRAREAARRESHAPRNIYAHAGRPGARVPGIDVPYEPARAPALVLNTEALDVAAAGRHVAALARRLTHASPAPRMTAGRGGVLWITGRPGSGKSTLARGVADGLRVAGVEPFVAELSVMRRAVLGDRFASEAEEEMVHLMLASVARTLAARGIAVIVDATTPRRSWRDVARRSIPVFAEVQLVCPPDLCAEREREARWHLHGGAARPAASTSPSGSGAPDICLDYEESPAAELTLHTHVQGHWSAVRQTLSLAWRLLASEPGHCDDPGRRPDMLVRDLMTPDPITAGPETPVFEARQEMTRRRIRHLLVTEHGRLVGIVTDRDIRLNLPSQATSLSVWEVNYLLARLTVASVMTKTVITVGPDRDAAEAARIMLDHRIGGLPVVEGERVVGIVTETDIVRAFAKGVAAAPAGRHV